MKAIRLGDWPVRTKLMALLAIPLGGLLVFGVIATRTVQTLRVNGPAYRRVVDSKDLIADVLPPPEYIIETYLALFETLDETHHPNTRALYIERTRQLREDFETRRRFWAERLPPGDLRTALVDDAGGAAHDFFAIQDRQFLPAVLRGDLEEAHHLAYGPLAEAYNRHRRAVDRVVVLARARTQSEENDAEVTRVRWSTAMALTGVLTLLLAAWTGVLMALAILRPVRRLDQAIAARARGEGFTPVESGEKDELGRLARSFNAMIQVVDARTASLRDANAELHRANQELEGFSYAVSHDLRTPLRAILGFSGSLVEEFGAALPAEARRALDVVEENARRMGQLIDDLLAFARHSRLACVRKAMSLEPVVRACFDDLEGDRRGRNVDLRVGSLPPCDADPALIKQVFMNLLSNAIKFTRKRDPAVIEVGSLSASEGTVYFVRDNGEGFDMRYVDKVFVVFQRLHDQEDYEGTGVGLALVQKIVSRHGGRVWADATPGHGATFFLTLPRQASAA